MPNFPVTISVAACPGIIMNISPFHFQENPSLDGKLYGLLQWSVLCVSFASGRGFSPQLFHQTPL